MVGLEVVAWELVEAEVMEVVEGEVAVVEVVVWRCRWWTRWLSQHGC